MQTITDTFDHSVLVVDDEPQVVWVLQYSLEAEGYTTFAARDDPRSSQLTINNLSSGA